MAAKPVSPTSNARLQVGEVRIASGGAANRLDTLIDEIRGTGELAIRYRNLLVTWANEIRHQANGTSDDDPISVQIMSTWDLYEGYRAVIPAGTVVAQEITRNRLICAMAYWAVTGTTPTLAPGAADFANTLVDPIRAGQIRRSANPDPGILSLYGLVTVIQHAAAGTVDMYTFARSLFELITMDMAEGEVRPYLAEVAFTRMLLG